VPEGGKQRVRTPAFFFAGGALVGDLVSFGGGVESGNR